jgi:hypothetical protein
MNKADVVVLISVFFVLIPLIEAMAAKIFANETIYGRLEIAVWFGLMTATLFIDDNNLWRSVIFGGVSGFLVQPLTDLYLTKKTLVYGDKKYFFLNTKTPTWVASLWGITLTQLSYLWTRFDSLMIFLNIPLGGHVEWFLFVAIGFTYFFIFEFAVSNYTDWWRRKHCKKIWDIAVYASFAELCSLIFLPVFLTMCASLLIFGGLMYGLCIMIFFISYCKMAYNPKID